MPTQDKQFPKQHRHASTQLLPRATPPGQHDWLRRATRAARARGSANHHPLGWPMAWSLMRSESRVEGQLGGTLSQEGRRYEEKGQGAAMQPKDHSKRAGGQGEEGGPPCTQYGPCTVPRSCYSGCARRCNGEEGKRGMDCGWRHGRGQQAHFVDALWLHSGCTSALHFCTAHAALCTLSLHTRNYYSISAYGFSPAASRLHGPLDQSARNTALLLCIYIGTVHTQTGPEQQPDQAQRSQTCP